MKKKYITLFLAAAIISFSSCRNDDELLSPEDESFTDYPDWTETTHGKSTPPNYDTVFPQNKVMRFDIKISSEDWTTMQNDIESLLGSTNVVGPGVTPGGPPKSEELTTAISTDDPIWVKSSVYFNGKEWYNVGIRYKGNSSLQSAYQSGNNKLSLKLDFNQFGNDYPILNDQRFFGFKQLNLNNNFDDASLMREKVGADLFRKFGLVAAQTSFCVVYLDNGSGPQYYGVYALVEEVDDTVLDSQFANGSGNLYKPDGDAAAFSAGSYDESELVKKNNEELADYSDVKALYDAINSSTRTSDVEAWKTELSSVLDIDVFLKWLAANTVIQNWDTYALMTHNYYLYNNPTTDKLTWIPWDNNEAFQFGKQSGAVSLELSEVGSEWPLISYIIAVDEYRDVYDAYLEEFITDVFVPSTMSATYSDYEVMLKEYAYAEEQGYTFITNDSDFDSAVATIISHAQERTDAVLQYLNK